MSKKKQQITESQSLQIEEIRFYIKNFIKNWRLNEGLTQREFSKLANVHVNSIYNIECQRGTNLITLINCISAMDGMTVSEFFELMK
jgi:transcriptional regulator with XRE-family HTH domain